MATPRIPPKIARTVAGMARHKGNIDQGVFLTDLMEAFGGSRHLAQTMYNEFQSAPPGGLARTKMMQTIQSLIISTTAANLTNARDPEKMTEEELVERIGAYFEQIEAGELVAPADLAERDVGMGVDRTGGRGSAVGPGAGGGDPVPADGAAGAADGAEPAPT